MQIAKTLAALFLSSALVGPFSARAQTVRPGEELPPWTESTLDIHWISTGKGDAMLCVFPDGTTMLADPGASARPPPRVTAQRPDGSRTPGEWITRYVRHMLPPESRDALDYLLLTHFHGDHMGDLVENGKKSSLGDYLLTGVTEVGDAIPIRKILDRGWPDYSYPAPLTDPMVKNYRAFLQTQAEKRGTKIERFLPGRKDQVALTHRAASYPEFEFRNVAANGEIWTGAGGNTRQHFPPVESLPRADIPSENMCSIGYRMSYGPFDYFHGGDMPGMVDEGAPPWHDVQTPVVQAVGPVEVAVVPHHGFHDSANASFAGMLRARAYILAVWAPSHPDARVMGRLLSERLYPGPREVFATSSMEANRVVLGNALRLASSHGHIVIRVAPGGRTYQVIILDDSAETWKITAVHGPYDSR